GDYHQVNQQFLGVEGLSHKTDGDILAVRTDADVIYFFDLAELPDIVQLGQADLGEPFYDFTLIDDDLYVARGFDGLWRYRLTDHNNAQFTDSSMLGIHYIRVDHVGSELYALDDYNGILRYDIRSDGFGQFQDYLFLPFQATSFAKADSLMLIAVNSPRLLVGSFTGAAPAVVDTIPLLFTADRIHVGDTLAATFNAGTATTEVFSLNNREPYVSELAIAPDTTFNGSVRVGADGASLLMPSDAGGLARYDLSDVQSGPIGERVLERAGPIGAVSLHNGQLFTGGGNNPVDIYDLAGDGRPVFDTTYYAGLRGVGELEFNGDTMFVMYEDLRRIFMIDLSNDTIPFLQSVGPDLEEVRDIVIGDHPVDTMSALFATGLTGVEVFSISDSSGVISRGIINTLGGVTGTVYMDSLIFIASRKAGVRVYRLYNDFTVEYRTSISFSLYPTHIRGYAGRLMAFAGGDILLFDVSNPSNIVLDTIVDAARLVTESAIDNNQMYTIGPNGMAVYDVSGAVPVLIDQGGRPGTMIDAEDGFIAASDGNSVNIYRMSDIPTDVPDDNPILPRHAQLAQNYPNPFNPSTTIGFSLPQQTDVSLTVYNVLGRTVRVLVNDSRPAGEYEVVWDGRGDDGRSVASGVYFYRLVTEQQVQSRKMLLVK
ncbi:T9SS type A sorting domain-containing protein, partial [candidate division GN15 bacterium]|nr:T9SS type A sorting domain-containing protein [candidate division GN15 bacterium]